jgi:predicted DNA-binding transcriptional regulator YafY
LVSDQILKQGRSIPRNENADFVEVVLPNKIDPYKSYGVKLISLFARLMFSSESHSLTDLSRMLWCSKQTVLRLVDDIRRAYGVEIEESFQERRKYFRLKKKTGKTPTIPLTSAEITTLQMCKAFAEHLLGPELLKEATQGIEKSRVHFGENLLNLDGHFASFNYGFIDYTPHQETIRRLIRAMEERKVCEVTYKAALSEKTKVFFVKPLKLFSHKDTLYLSTKLARYPGSAYREPDYHPLLAVHRIRNLAITERTFEYPKCYDFRKEFDGHFGLMRGKPFKVTVEFSGYAATYVAEKIWSADQKIKKYSDGRIMLQFSTCSKPEVISWVLSFGNEAKLIKPKLFQNLARLSSNVRRGKTINENSFIRCQA